MYCRDSVTGVVMCKPCCCLPNACLQLDYMCTYIHVRTYLLYMYLFTCPLTEAGKCRSHSYHHYTTQCSQASVCFVAIYCEYLNSLSSLYYFGPSCGKPTGIMGDSCFVQVSFAMLTAAFAVYATIEQTRPYRLVDSSSSSISTLYL